MAVKRAFLGFNCSYPLKFERQNAWSIVIAIVIVILKHTLDNVQNYI